MLDALSALVNTWFEELVNIQVMVTSTMLRVGRLADEELDED